MKRISLLIFILALTLVLASCGPKQESNNNVSLSGKLKVLNTSAEVTEGDFIYRLVSEKEEYRKDESVKMYAELEYIGDNEEVTIYHAASPFNFPMGEKSRGFSIGYGMDQPLLNTTLIKGEPIHEVYKRSGGYGSQDDDAYVSFMKEFLKSGFLEGYYVVNGFADFYTESKHGGKIGKEDFRIQAQIDFKVNR